MTRLRVLVAPGLLLALAGLSGCGAETAPDVVPAAGGAAASSGATVSLTLPSGVLSFDVGEPTDELTVDDTADETAYTAPDGRDLVLVTWQQDGTAPYYQLGLAPGEQFPPATLAVDDGDQTSELGTFDLPGGTAQGAAWVSVPEDGDWAITATFDGETQSIDPATGEREPGAAAAYYADLPSAGPAPQELAEPAEGLGYGLAAGVRELALLPYLAEQGWAPAGSAWLVVDTEVSQVAEFTYRTDRGTSRYEPTLRESTTTLDGAEPAAVLSEEVFTTNERASYAFEVPLGTERADHSLDLVRRYELRRRSGEDPAPSLTEAEIAFSLPVTTPAAP